MSSRKTTTPKPPTTGSKSKTTKGSRAVRDAVIGNEVIVGGERFEIPTQDDLPRSVRRAIRQIQVKYQFPSGTDRSRGRPDVYGMAFEIGELVLQHLGSRVDFDADDLSPEEAREQDAVITIVGMRVMADRGANEDGGEGEDPKAEPADADAD